MVLWRIAVTKYVSDLSGTGAKMAGGRWNSKGVPVVYCGGSQALCALESLVHFEPAIAPPLSVITLEVPDASFASRSLIAVGQLPSNWRDFPAPMKLQSLGDAWAKGGGSLILQVPSAVIPAEPNYLLNVGHPEMAQVKIGLPKPFAFDPRLFKSKP
jgi:RES domain-containing protein